MKFEFEKKTNIRIGQTLYGIVEVSIYTYDGVYPIMVRDIDYNNEKVIFSIDQPCQYVSCSFKEMTDFVFETKEEAEHKMRSLEFGEGLRAQGYYGY